MLMPQVSVVVLAWASVVRSVAERMVRAPLEELLQPLLQTVAVGWSEASLPLVICSVNVKSTS